MRHTLLLLFFAISPYHAVHAAWPHLGELATVESRSSLSLPESLDAAQARWMIELPGPGASTPLIVGDRIFLTCEIDGANGVVCYDKQGQELWRDQFGTASEAKHRNATAANPSATTDGEHVAVYFRNTSLACYTIDGQQLWRKNLADQFGAGVLWWDLGTSPVASSQGVVVAVMHEGDSYLATFDWQSGDVVWRTPRNYQCREESDQAYTTPAVVTVDGVETIVTLGADHLTGHDARDGKLLWDYAGLNPRNEGMWRNIASAAVAEGVAVVPFGRGDFLCGVRLGGSGDVTETAEMWTIRGVGADAPTPHVVDGRVYVLGDGKRSRGTVTCVDLQSGEIIWSDQLPRSGSTFYSSPLVIGDRLYCLREDGTAIVCHIDDGLEMLSETDLGDRTVATPVLLDGDIVVRTREKLFRFGAE